MRPRFSVHATRELEPTQRPLPCSTIEGDVFYWQPPIMALGDFPVSLKTADGGEVKLQIRIALP